MLQSTALFTWFLIRADYLLLLGLNEWGPGGDLSWFSIYFVASMLFREGFYVIGRTKVGNAFGSLPQDCTPGPRML